MPKDPMSWSRLLTVMVIGLSLTLSSGESWAQETRQTFSDTIHVVQKRPVLQKGRLDLVPRFGGTINDSIHRSYKVGVNANYHFTERFYAGAIFEWYNFGGILGGPTSAFKDVNNETRTTADSAYLNWNGGLEFGFAPIVGKFALFNRSIFFYDVALTAGGLWTDSSSIALPSAKGGPGGTFSVTNRIFFNRWMALNLEVRNVMFMASLRNVPDTTLTHAVTASVGLSLYLPMNFKYSDESDD